MIAAVLLSVSVLAEQPKVSTFSRSKSLGLRRGQPIYIVMLLRLSEILSSSALLKSLLELRMGVDAILVARKLGIPNEANEKVA
jgi:hypothetical protein